MNQVELQVAEILHSFGSRERLIGVVDHYEGSTLFIRSGDRFFFAFTSEALGFQPGAPVSFRKDGMRAKDVKLFQPGEPETNGSTEEFSAKS